MRLLRTLSLAFSLITALGATAAFAQAPAKGAALLPLVTQGNISKEMTRALGSALDRELQKAGAVTMSGRVTAEQLGSTNSLGQCQKDPSCLGRLATTLRAEAVVIAVAERAAGGRVRCNVRLVSSTGAILHEAKLELDKPAEADKAVSAIAPALAQKITSSGQDPALATNVKPQKGGDELELTPIVESDPNAPRTLPVTPVPPPPERRHILGYAGIGAGVVGLALVGIGIGYVKSSRDIDERLDDAKDNEDSTTSQLEARDLNERSDKHLSRGNTLLVVGSITAAVGAGLAGYDFFWLNRAKTSVSVGPSSAAVQVNFAF